MPPRTKARRTSASHAAGEGRTGLLSLPQELLKDVLRKAAAQSIKYPTALFELAKTCKVLNAELENPAYWELAWTQYRLGERGSKQEAPPPDISPREALRLSSAVGCMLCGQQRIRKVYWPFRLRLCVTCLKNRTVPHWVLTKNYGLADDLFKHLPSWETTGWSQANREQLTVYLYWRADIAQVVQQVHGLPSLEALEERRSKQAAERQLAAEKQRLWVAETERLVQEQVRQAEERRRHGIEVLAATAASFDPELRATLAQLQSSDAFQQQLSVFLAHKGSVPPSVDAFARICVEVREQQARDQRAADEHRAAEEKKRKAAEKKRLAEEERKDGITMLATALASFDPQLLPRPHQLLASQTFQHQLKTFLASKGDPSALPGPGALTMICKEVRASQAKRQHHELAKGKAWSCEVCGDGRLFTPEGLRDHTRAKHGEAAAAAVVQRFPHYLKQPQQFSQAHMQPQQFYQGHMQPQQHIHQSQMQPQQSPQGHVQPQHFPPGQGLAPAASAAAAAALGRQQAAGAAQAASASSSAAAHAGDAGPWVKTEVVDLSRGPSSSAPGTAPASSAAPAAAAVKPEPAIDLTAASSMAPPAAAGPATPSLPIDLTASDAAASSARALWPGAVAGQASGVHPKVEPKQEP